MGDHNTRMAELRKDVDNLKGSVDSVGHTVAELTTSVEAKFAQALEEIKKMMLGNGNNHAQNGPVADGGEEVLRNRAEDRVARAVEHQFPFRNYQVDVAISKFDGTGLKDWLYKCEQFFDVDGTPEDSKVKLASCKLEGRALQWHQ
ncbi:hypothetical protein A4A49_57786, partial [Nicotiana attenuata]